MSGCETVSPIELLKHKKINRRQNMWSVWVTATSNRAVIQGAVVKSNVQMTTCPRRGWADCGQPMSKRHGLSSICPCPPAGPALSTLRATQLPGSSIRLPLEEREVSLAAEQYLTYQGHQDVGNGGFTTTPPQHRKSMPISAPALWKPKARLAIIRSLLLNPSTRPLVSLVSM
jgi:hypothetical protein